jgi:hypothetical protein
MNDTSSGWSPDFNDDDDDDRPLRSDIERSLMDRARRAAERDHQRGPRRYVQHAIAFVAALGIVLLIGLGFDAFLTSMQKLTHMFDEADKQQQQQQQQRQPAKPAQPDPTSPMPAYVVPSEQAPAN